MVLTLLFLFIFLITLVCWMLAYSSSHYFDPQGAFSLFYFSVNNHPSVSISSYLLNW